MIKKHINAMARSNMSSRPAKIFFFPDMNKKLEEAAHLLSFVEFRRIFDNIVKKCIKKAETELSTRQAVPSETTEYLSMWL